MKGKTNMPLEAVLALVHMVKARQQELRNHTKAFIEFCLGQLDAASGWTVRNQTWHEITTELNIRYGRELTVDQCMKKLLNIKSMTRYKLEDQERKRKRPGMEHFEVKLTPAEREYIRLFYHGAPPNPPVPGSASWEHIQMLLGGDLPMQSFSLPSTAGRGSNGGRMDGISLLKDEFLGEEDEVFEIGDDEGEDSLPDERPLQIESVVQTSTALRGQRHLKRVEIGDSLTNAILGILPQHSVDDVEAGSSSGANGRLQSVEHQQQPSQLLADPQLISSPGALEAVSADGSAIAAGIQRHTLLGAIPIRSQQQQQPVESQQISTPACIGGQSLLRNVPLTTVRSSNFVSHHPFEQQSHVKQQQQQQHLMSNCHSEQNFAGRKRRAFHSQQLNGFEHCAIDDVETVELRLKRLKCELIEKQLMELGHQEEWRLKQEFLLGRQTAALENIVIQLRQIKEKLK